MAKPKPRRFSTHELLGELYGAIEEAFQRADADRQLAVVRARIHILEIESSERASQRLSWATWALVASTVALAAATIILAIRA